MNTFGEFYDVIVVANAGAVESEMYMEEWESLVDQQRWDEVLAMELTEGLIKCFAEDMHTYIRERMVGICTDELYESVFVAGREFLKIITQVSKEFGVDVAQVCGLPLTISEAISLSRDRKGETFES